MAHYAIPISSMGGGANLNVIYSASQPTNPRENTIWINNQPSLITIDNSLIIASGTNNEIANFNQGDDYELLATTVFRCIPKNNYRVTLNDNSMYAVIASFSTDILSVTSAQGIVLNNITSEGAVDITITAPDDATYIAVHYQSSNVADLTITDVTESLKPIWGVGSENPFATKTVVNHLDSLTLKAGYWGSSGAVTSASSTYKEMYAEEYIPVTSKGCKFIYTSSTAKSLWLGICEYTTNSSGAYTFSKRITPINNVTSSEEYYYYTPSSANVTAIRVSYRSYDIATLTLEDTVYETLSDTQYGTIWIKTNNLSPIHFNIAKKDGTSIYCSEAYQYVKDSWIPKEMKGYVDGEWISSKATIVDIDNDICNIDWTGSHTWTTVTQETTGLQFYHYALNARSYAVTNDAYDLTYFSKMTYEIASTSSMRLAYVGVGTSGDITQYTTNSGTDLSCFTTYNKINGTGKFEINLRDLTGMHYIWFRMMSATDTTSPKIVFSKITLE